MYIGVKFKGKNKDFKGRTYNFELAKDEDIPKVGDIIRLTDSDWEFLFYGTRTKVVRVTPSIEDKDNLMTVHCIKASLND